MKTRYSSNRPGANDQKLAGAAGLGLEATDGCGIKAVMRTCAGLGECLSGVDLPAAVSMQEYLYFVGEAAVAVVAETIHPSDTVN